MPAVAAEKTSGMTIINENIIFSLTVYGGVL